jgi:DNA helicase-2/ATP-dependent DNA helicase PcrA
LEFIADLHIHSHLSRATARNLNLEHLNLWAQLKGITVVATGDFTHPQWFSELSQKLEPKEAGLFSLKPEHAAQTAPEVPASCRAPVRFILSAEISSIYKKDGKTRKVHNLIFAPTLEVVEKINRKLDRIGNIASDGRPILGLDCKRLLEIVLETSEDAFLIPAHIWTPWFSVLGSKSGFDDIKECFEDLTAHIFAVETGLSSDPAMNWRVSSLDGFTLVSNSDAHSPANLGREANLFDTELSYFAIRDALKSGDPRSFRGTLEYFAEEGKYHFDGHRKCEVRLAPRETLLKNGVCPVCGKPVTIGVMYRVEQLADRKPDEKPPGAHPYTSLLPLTDVLGEVFQVGTKSKRVVQAFRTLVEKLGPEFEILRKRPFEDLDRRGPPLFAEAIKRMRNNQVHIAPGYDGEFGTIALFDEEERTRLTGQESLFPASPAKEKKARSKTKETDSAHFAVPFFPGVLQVPDPVDSKPSLNEAQQEAVAYAGGALLIVAGPGTGKTFTLACRIAHLLERRGVLPEQVLAVTFTNKAAEEMADRISQILRDTQPVRAMTVKTFHALCFDIISAEAKALGMSHPLSLLNEADALQVVKRAVERVRDGEGGSRPDPDALSELISKVKQLLLSPEDDLAGSLPEAGLEGFARVYKAYEEILAESRLLDFDDLILRTVKLFETNDRILKKYQEKFRFIFVDEYQDINYAQYRLVRLFAPRGHNLCVIGDPDQAIYGFRGADVEYFNRFCDDYPGAGSIRLSRNYRSTETILRASGQLIRKNDDTLQGGKIWSGIDGARALTVAQLPTERAEAEYIVQTIDQEVGGITHFSMDSGRVKASERERSFSDFVVLYRIKEQGKALEEAFQRSGIPFQTIGHEKLQDRSGIRELISYLKVGCSVACDLDVERILNFPKRGIGDATVKALKQWAGKKHLSVFSALERLDSTSGLKALPRRKLGLFLKDLTELKARLNGKSVCEQIGRIVSWFKIMDAFDGDEAFKQDLAALLSLSESFQCRSVDFLAHLSLQKPQDRYDPHGEMVCLMTMHAAKGLEFPVVFIAGCEDGLIPFRRREDEPGDIAEERRLFYVAMTRAQEKIYLTHTMRRLWFGRRVVQRESMFLEAIEEDLKKYDKPFAAHRGRPEKDAQLSLFDLQPN